MLSWHIVPELLVPLNIQAPSSHNLQKCLAAQCLNTGPVHPALDQKRLCRSSKIRGFFFHLLHNRALLHACAVSL